MAVIVIGNFDGVHTGHRRVVQEAVKEARALEQSVTALTFDVHPKTFFCPDDPVKKIVDDAKKEKLLKEAGADEVVFQTFDRTFADTSAEDYLHFLKENYHCDVLVCGENFTLGRGGKTTVGELKETSSRLCIKTVCVPMTALCDGRTISSTNIRHAVAEGDMKTAHSMLGRYFALEGEVMHGRHIGTTMDLPTANLVFEKDRLLPKKGVYVTFVQVGDSLWQAVTNVGVAPTVSDDGKTVVETHLTKRVRGTEDLALYGKTVTVGFVERLRDERKFASLDLLKQQICTDAQKSAVIFGNIDDKNVKF